MLFDAHLDLSMNVRRGRDVTRPAREQPVVENEIATVGLPDLRAGGVRRICATIFCEPARDGKPGCTSPQDAFDEAMAHLALYRGLAPALRANEIDHLLLLEGADCVRTPDDLTTFASAGVKIIGLAWRGTRYAGGTGAPGPLTEAGRELVGEIDRLGLVHDASHLAEQSFWDLVDRAQGPVIASHSNCRAIVGHDAGERHLTDEMIRAIVQRGGVVGINVYDRFLLPHNEYGTRRATIADVVRHIAHVCELAGDAQHVGLGTDMDGGLGREQIPVEIETSADLPRIGPALRDAGFDEQAVADVLFNNWDRFFNRHL